jgi:dTDP-glucose pyrophosphorylase
LRGATAFIDREQLAKLAAPLQKNGYGKYLNHLLAKRCAHEGYANCNP